MESTRIDCPICGKERSFAIYADGGGYCFSGRHEGERAISASKLKRLCNEGHAERPVEGTDVSAEEHPEHTEDWMLDGKYVDIPERGLKASTCEAMGIRTGSYYNKPCYIFDIKNRDGEIVGQQIRLKNEKQFFNFGDTSGTFFGHRSSMNKGKYLWITEGAFDAASLAQLTQCEWPVLSLPSGVGTATNIIKKHLDWLDQYERIYICFDNDSDENGRIGQKTAQSVAEILSPGKAYIVNMPLKDASDMLMSGRGEEAIKCVWGAKVWRPDQIRGCQDFTVEDLSRLKVNTIPWPWPDVQAATGGVRIGDLYSLFSPQNAGKTTFMKELCLDWLGQGKKVGMVLLEETAVTTAASIVAMQKNIPWKSVVRDPSLLGTPEQLKHDIEANDNLFIYDSKGVIDMQTVLSRVLYMGAGLGCDFIVVDNITALAGADDVHKTYSKMAAELLSIKNRTGSTIFVIGHTVKNMKGAEGEEKVTVNKSDLKNAGPFLNLSSFVFALERPYGSPHASLKILKGRDMIEEKEYVDRLALTIDGRLKRVPTAEEVGVEINYQHPA